MKRSLLSTIERSTLTFLAVLLHSALICQAQTAPPPVPAEPLRRQLDDATKTGDVAGAVVLAEKIASEAEAKHIDALYTAAQLHARLGHREQVYLFLNRAIGAGFRFRQQLLEDEAFKDYRGDDMFKALARKAWARGYADLLERQNREDVQKSPQVLKVLAFKPGERVADIGAGTGYFTLPVAKAVGPSGVVMALDIAPEMLEYLDMRLKAQRITNVRLKKVQSDDPQLEPGSVDTILMVDTIHYVKDRTAYAKKLRGALAPGGRLVIIDYVPRPMNERPWGPPPEQQFPRSQLDQEMAAAGFAVFESHDFLPEQFFVVYTPQ